MTDNVVEQRGLPVNEQGSIVASHSLDNRTVVGCLAPGYIPVNSQGQVMFNLPAQTPTYETGILYFDTQADANVTDPGACYWNPEYKTLNLNMGIDGVVAQLGQETYTLCLNNTGATIPNGSVVCITGSGGEHPNIGLASAGTYSQAQTTIGVTTHASNDGEHVLVTRYGLIHEIDTSLIPVGSLLYLSTTPGQFTTAKPSPADTLIRIGFCNKSDATDGEILIDTLIEVNNEGYQLDAQVRAASSALPATPTEFVWTTEAIDSLGGYDSSTGVITIPFDGEYSLVAMFNPVTTGTVKMLYFASQIWNGSDWVAQEFSTRQSAVRLDDKNQIIFSSQNKWTAGTQLRIVVWGSAAGINVITESPSAGYTVVGARLLISGVKTI